MVKSLKVALPTFAIILSFTLSAVFYVPFQINGIDVVRDKNGEYWTVIGYGNKTQDKDIQTTFKIVDKNTKESCHIIKPFKFLKGRHVHEEKLENLIGEDCFKMTSKEDSSWELSLYADKKGIRFPNEILEAEVDFKK